MAALSELVDGAETVVHIAGAIKARDRSAFFAVNAEGARNVALAANGRRVIHVRVWRPRAGPFGLCRGAKGRGRKSSRRICGANATVVRPPAVFGPGDRETLAIFKAARGPIMTIPGVPAARVAVGDIEDVVAVLRESMERSSNGETVTIGGARPSGYAWRELAQAAARAVGGRPILLGVPPAILKTAGAMCEQAGRWRPSPPIFSLGKARETLHADWAVSEAEQGWTAELPYTTLDDSFACAVAGYRSRGWLK